MRCTDKCLFINGESVEIKVTDPLLGPLRFFIDNFFTFYHIFNFFILGKLYLSELTLSINSKYECSSKKQSPNLINLSRVLNPPKQPISIQRIIFIE